MSMDRRSFIRNLVVGGAAVPALSACGGGSGGSGGAGHDDQVAPGRRQLRFLVIGDMGTGNAAQYHVARAMEAVVAEQGADFVLATGDNIYEEGVTSPSDQGFLEKFEYPYQNIDLPFYLCLGNHDNACSPLGGGSHNTRGDHQVAYHYAAERYSNKWRMPARFYNQSFGGTAEQPFMELFVVDSNPLTSFYQDHDPRFSWQEYGFPQQRMIREDVQASQAHWKIAMSHVPYLSNGKHGNAGNLDEGLRWLFTSPDADGARYKRFIEECFKDRADVLFTGHDHVMQWLKPTPALGPTEIIVSGAGGKTDSLKAPNRNPVRFQQGGECGFVWVELNEAHMVVAFFNVHPKTGAWAKAYEEVREKPVMVARV